jgi:hypothetical protein
VFHARHTVDARQNRAAAKQSDYWRRAIQPRRVKLAARDRLLLQLLKCSPELLLYGYNCNNTARVTTVTVASFATTLDIVRAR